MRLVCCVCMLVSDESKTHLFLRPFFIYSRLKSSFQCKIIEPSPRFVFCMNLKKLRKNQQKRRKDEKKCNVATLVEAYHDIPFRVTTKIEECCDIMAMSRHQTSNVATSDEKSITSKFKVATSAKVSRMKKINVVTSVVESRDIKSMSRHRHQDLEHKTSMS